MIETRSPISTKALTEPVAPEPVETVEGSGKSIAEIAIPTDFWDTALGRALAGRNKTGKIIYSVAGAAVTLLTGINIEPITQTLTQPVMTDFFTDINFWTIIAFAFGILITWLKSKTGASLDRLLDKADLGAQLYADFKAKDSDQGTKISDAERGQLLDFLGSIFIAQQKNVKK